MKNILGYKIGELSIYIKKLMESYLSEVNLGEGQYLILRNIYEDENITQKEMSITLDVNKATITKSIKKLSENGYVVRKKNPLNSKSYKLLCTKKGMDIVVEVERLIEVEKEILTTGIDGKDLEIFLKVLEKMTQNVFKELQRSEKREWRIKK